MKITTPKNIILFVIVLLIEPISSFGQANNSDKETFLEAESYFLHEEFSDALPLYSQLKEKFPENYNLDYRIGRCYLDIPYDKLKAVVYLESAVKHISAEYKEGKFSENKTPTESLFYLADAYRINNQIDKAISTYTLFKSKVNSDIYDIGLIDNQIENCYRAIDAIKNPIDIDQINLGNVINSRFSEKNPVVSPNEDVIVYTSKLPFYEALFYSRKVNGNWTTPVNLMPVLGVDGDCFPSCISYDGNELYFYRSNDYLGDLYVSYFINGKWNKLKKLNSNINTKYWESHASLSRDGKTLYFTSNREGGYGGLDIYQSKRSKGDDWEPAVNLGSTINTRYNDETPFIMPDGNRLYFSSYGHETIGGYDIFYSDLNSKGEWLTPKNIGYPINTTNDDIFYCPVRDGSVAYMAICDSHGMGRYDIVRLKLFTGENPRTYKISGLMKLPQNISNASVYYFALYDKIKKDTIIRNKIYGDKIVFETNPGQYEVCIRSDRNIFQSLPLSIDRGSKDTSRVLNFDLAIQSNAGNNSYSDYPLQSAIGNKTIADLLNPNFNNGDKSNLSNTDTVRKTNIVQTDTGNGLKTLDTKSEVAVSKKELLGSENNKDMSSGDNNLWKQENLHFIKYWILYSFLGISTFFIVFWFVRKKEKKEGNLKLCFTFKELKPLNKPSIKRTMKILISILFFTHIVVFTVCSQTDFRYTESIKEVQEYLLNNDFTESLYILKNLEKEGYSNANMNYLIGVCYVNSLTNKQLSIDYLLRACNSVSKDYNSDNPSELNAPPEAILYLGDANLMNDKIKEARQCYLRYLNLSYIDEHKKDIARSRIKNCLFARLQMDNLLKVVFENAGKSINTGIANSNACISADGKKMVFLRSMKFYDAIFYAVKTDSGWQAPENITSQIGSDGEFIPTSLSFDGTRLLLMTFTDPDGNEIYESVYNGKKWDKVKRLEAPVNSKYHDIDASYGIDDHTIYFSSNRAGGFGGYDIYKANIDVTNKTYKVENLGNTINSLGDEKSPSLIENGKILVFNTNYRNSIGGYDYYYSQLLNIDKWSEPLDIGYPINSTSDDNELKFTATSPKKGWFSRSDPKGTSIYFFDCPMFSTLKLVPISGKVVINENIYADSENISLAVVDVAMHDTAFILKPNTDGSYFAELYPGKFKLIVKKQGEKDLEQAFSIPLSFNEENFSLESKFGEPALTKVSKKDTIQVVDILYGFNQWEISKDEKAMLNNLIVELKKHAVKSIQLNGYSDALGSEAYNVTLSFGRAQNVKEIFMAQGFSGKNIIVQGKGNSVYVAKNTNPDGKDNPEGRAFNRRVEIFITLESDTAVILRKDRVPEKLKLKNQ